MNRSFSMAVAAGACLLVSVSARAADTFKRILLTDQFWSEGAWYGDYNHDGKMDVTAGPFWYEGPDFQKRHAYRPATQSFKLKKDDGTEATVEGYEGALGKKNAYSDDFFTYGADFDGDGWDDILVIGLPGTPAFWFKNPGKGAAADQMWEKHEIYGVIDNESPEFRDINGDGKPDIVCNSGGFLGYVTFNWEHPTELGTFHPISPKGKWHKYTHGMGCGDVNGDGRNDLIEQDGWWEQPASLAGDPQWKFHAFPFAPGGAAQMLVYDFNGDGLNDIITCLNPHRYGLAWYEQVRQGGEITFKQHIIMNDKDGTGPSGIHFSQPHAMALADINGDGVLDIVTGKRFWAHGPAGDVEANAPAILCWFKTVRGAGGTVDFVPEIIDENSGVGTQVTTADLNGDGKPDIIVGNKKGAFVFLHRP